MVEERKRKQDRKDENKTSDKKNKTSEHKQEAEELDTEELNKIVGGELGITLSW